MGIKQKKDSKKISINSVRKRGSSCEQYPAFSFRYLTTNSTFNFDYFGKDKTAADVAAQELALRIIEVTENPYTYWSGKSKDIGIETLPFYQLKVKPNKLETSSDDKAIVFRFHKQKYRIIGIRLESCPTFYVIAFDFNFSAYQH